MLYNCSKCLVIKKANNFVKIKDKKIISYITNVAKFYNIKPWCLFYNEKFEKYYNSKTFYWFLILFP